MGWESTLQLARLTSWEQIAQKLFEAVEEAANKAGGAPVLIEDFLTVQPPDAHDSDSEDYMDSEELGTWWADTQLSITPANQGVP